MATYTTGQLAEQLGATLEGPPDVVIRGVRELSAADGGHIVLLRDRKFDDKWPNCEAAAALAPTRAPVEAGQRVILRTNAIDAAWLGLLRLFAPPVRKPEPGIHPSAVVESDVQIDDGASIGPHCTVGSRTSVGRGAVLRSHVTLGDDVRIGEDAELHPGVYVGDRCAIGRRTVLWANVSIGADGFGYQADKSGANIEKVPQIGWVEIGNDVEIGACTCVDRGTVGPTTVGDGSKIDNLCQIAHNCRLGKNVVLAAQVGMAGSVTVGDGVMMGGKVAVGDHLTIGHRARIAAAAALMSDVPAGEAWGGYPAQPRRDALREIAAVRRLPMLIREVEKFIQKDD